MSQPARGSRIEIRNINKRYAGFRAVDDVSLDIRAGEFITFLGPSGSGKTTTLNMIAGFEEITTGEILLDDQPIGNVPPHKRNIGMVFQSYSLFPHMTVFDNVAYPLRRRRQPSDVVRKKVGDALEMVQLGAFAARYPKELSGGQQQRVALARALVFSPRVLLMDEPFGALDKKLREHLQIEIKRLHKDLGMTFVFVTHDQEEALVLSDRIAVFNKGKLAQVGTAEELYERPSNLFVADFIGDSNILHGAATINGGDSALDFGGRKLGAPSNDEVSDNQDAALVIRPERISVRPLGAGTASGEISLEARINQIIYVGAHRKVVANLPNGQEVLAVIGADTELRAVDGADVQLVWPKSAGVLLPRSAS